MIAPIPDNVRFIKPKVAYRILGCGRTWFNQHYVKTGKLTQFKRGGNNVYFYPQVRNLILTEAREAGALK